MAYSLPVFNLTCNVWRSPNVPPLAADFFFDCQLRWSGKVPGGLSPVLVPGDNAMPTLHLPPLTDIQDGFGPSGAPDIVEVPAFSGRFYVAVYVDDIGKGFANEHRYAALQKWAGVFWPSPIP